MAYVLSVQTLHSLPGWSRAGIAFAVLLSVLLGLGLISGVWNLNPKRWTFIPVAFVTYCLVRAFPEVGDDWPLDQIDPLLCAFLGGIGTALALQAGVPFKALAYAQTASAAINIAAGSNQELHRYAGVVGNANEFGIQMMLGASLVWLLPRRAGLLPCLFAFVPVAYAVAASGSRTALCAAPFFLVLVFIQIFAAIKKHPALVSLSAVAVACLLCTLLASAVLERAEEITSISRTLDYQDNSFDLRSGMIQQGIRLWLQAPLFGQGLNGFERLSIFSTYAHDNYVELLCNTGLLGFLLFYAIHGYVLFKSRHLPMPLRLCSCVFILLLLAIDVGSINYIAKPTVMILMVLASMSANGQGHFESGKR
jgi:O-antigen ligase